MLAANPSTATDAKQPRGDGWGLLRDKARRLISREQAIPAAELLTLGTDVLRALRDISGRQSQFDDLLRQTIGRSDVTTRPPGAHELDKLENRLRRERRDRASRGI